VIRRALRESLLLVLIAAAPAALTGFQQLRWRPEKPLGPGEIRLNEANELGPSAIWVDARTRAKFERKKIPGAILLNAEEWDAQVGKFLDAWDPEKTIVVYGDREGDAAANVALRLREELKIDKVWTLHGGFEEWLRP
jgi:rhodanese-related sulfurtransferase